MNVFELFASLTLNKEDYEKQLNEAGNKASGFSNKVKAAAKVAAAGFAATATAVTAIGKAAIESYADYEQLVGGVETLFKKQSLDEFIKANKDAGKSIASLKEEYNNLEQAADTVVKNANNAYKTAGLSANQYMETVTSFTASLLSSLGGDTNKAAEYADLAITDMADNANKMGSSMESIQNAYQGFAKQNYTMLDNLKLGYGGTKEEMQRLLDDAEKLSGMEFDISSYSDIVQAIHVVQEEMGIAGATAQEAASTISGSAAAMSAAWTNLLTGLANGNADIDMLLNNFIESVAVTGKNVMPVVKTVLKNIFTTIEENAPEMVVQGIILMTKLAVGIVKAIPEIIKKIPEIIWAIEDSFDKHDAEFKKLGDDIVNGIKDGILRTWQNLVSWFNNLWSSLFSNRKVSVTVDKKTTGLAADSGRSIVDGSHANGLAYVPFDGYIAELHKGEAVIPAAQAKSMREENERPINIVVQSVLDGRVIGETAYRYNRDMRRAYGV